MVGSDTRGTPKIRDTASGFKQGGMGLVTGIWDGVTGLATEPYVAYKQEVRVLPSCR